MAPLQNETLKLFISYSRKDILAADVMVDALEAAGFEVIIDRRDLPYGEEWQAELADFIRAADTVIWLVSASSVASRWCNWELGEVQRLRKRLIPVVVESVKPEDLPEALGRIHVLPAEGAFKHEIHFDELVTAINTDRAWLKEHSRLGDRARQWIAKEKRADLLLRGSALADSEQWRDRQPRAAPNPSDDILDLILASRRAQGYRQRNTVIGSLAVAVLAIGLGIFTLISRQEAVRQEAIAKTRAQEAEEALTAATEASNNIVFNLAQQFEELGLPIGITSGILEEAQALQDKLAENAPDNPSLIYSRAMALLEVGDLQWLQGARSESGATYGKALLLLNQLWVLEPQNIMWARNFTVALDRVGRSRQEAGYIQGAMTAFERSLAIRRILVDREPKNNLLQRDLIVSITKIGNARMLAGNTQGALSAFEEALTINRLLVDREPKKIEWLSDHSGLVQDLGEIRLLTGDSEGGLSAYEEALTFRRKILNLAPQNTMWQRELSRALNLVGDARRKIGNAQGALSAYEEGLNVIRELTKSDPKNTVWQNDLTVSLGKVASMHIAAGDVERALFAHEEGLKIMRSLVEVEAQNTQWKHSLAVTMSNLANAHRIEGDLLAARSLYEEGLIIFRWLTERDPKNTKAQRDLAMSLKHIGILALQKRDMQAALAAYKEALTILRGLAKLNPQNTMWQSDLADILNSLGEVHFELDNVRGALAAYGEALDIRRVLAMLETQDTERQIDLAESLVKVANAGLTPHENVTDALAILKRLNSDGQLTSGQSIWMATLEGQLDAFGPTEPVQATAN